MHSEVLGKHSTPHARNLRGAEDFRKVLPETADELSVLPRQHLLEALQRVPPGEIENVLQTRLIPVAWIPNLVLYAACGPSAVKRAKQQGLKLVAQVAASDFHWAVRKLWGRKLLHKATQELFETTPQKSARKRVTPAQILVLLSAVGCIAFAMVYMPLAANWLAANVALTFFFLSVISLRLFGLLPETGSSPGAAKLLAEQKLPVYTVLVPVFRETAVLEQLLRALQNLNYPALKLDIKIIVEESDLPMRRALAGYVLPSQFDVIIVPSGNPQTKPRALNYALQFARGSLLTIYDAEDIPAPNQLRVAAREFSQDTNDLACLQAKLVFFNADENWLTRQFAAEYATLFGLILPSLADCGLPLPLGGTSNHFRTSILREVGAWDPYNVTEDADLGFRLARAGYRTGVIDSLTYEEANTQYLNWFRQRARWLKGFMQTWLVQMRNPAASIKELGLTGFWVLQSFTAGTFVSALFHPLLLALMVLQFVLTPLPLPQASLLAIELGGLNLVVFVLGYGVAMVAASKALRNQGMRGWWFTLCTMPIYWLLMSGAAWLALWQLITSPHSWNKTEHGLSKLQKTWNN